MKSFEALTLDGDSLTSDLAALEMRLAAQAHLKERAEILPFFQGRQHLCAALGLTNSAVELPNRWATELDLFGDFTCDVAAGDSEANAYTLIEFEPALEYSIFMKLHAKSRCGTGRRGSSTGFRNSWTGHGELPQKESHLPRCAEYLATTTRPFTCSL